MRIFLDNQRSAPDGFVRCFTVEKTLEFLRQNIVKQLSLTYDLGKCINCGGQVQTVWDGEKFVPIEPMIFQYEEPDIKLDFNSSSMMPGKNIKAIENDILSEEDIVIPKLKAVAVENKSYCSHVKNGLNLLNTIEDIVAKERFIPPFNISLHNVEDGDKLKMMQGAIRSIQMFYDLNTKEYKNESTMA